MKKNANYLTALVFILTVALSPAAGSRLPCEKLSGSGHTFATGPSSFQGTADVEFGDDSQTALVTTNLLGPPDPREDGTMFAATAHNFVLAGGSFSTFDRAVLSPTEQPGIYNLNTRAAISGGTGDFADACGNLQIHGTLNFLTGAAVWRFTGRLCSCS